MKKVITFSLSLMSLASISFAQIPNIIPSYEATNNTFTYNTILNSSNHVYLPKDLDFHPFTGDLWTINTGTVNSGGSTIKVTNPGQTNQTSLWQRDGNAWHFMSLPTGIAFSSDNGNFATSTGVFDANHNNTDFTGPSLWSSDPNIYAQPSPGNGSHLDMLHESPYCMGIASEANNKFWVFDAYSNDIVMYDFAADHGPGGSNHDDGRVRRYPELAVNWINANISSHLVLHRDNNWLYIVDGGNARVLRMDITTGTPGGIPSFNQNEILAEYVNVTGVTWEVVANTGLVSPSGIDVVGNRLIVSDFSNGDIVIYDISPLATMPATEVGRLVTNDPGIQGMVIGPQGRIWYANTTAHKIVQIEPTNIIQSVNGVVEGKSVSIYPNPTTGIVNIEKHNKSDFNTSIFVVDVSGKEVYRENASGLRNDFNLSHLSDGLYFITVNNGESSITEKLVLKH